MRISDFFKRVTGNKSKEFDFEILEEHPHNSYPDCHLVFLLPGEAIVFFHLFDGYDAAHQSFKLLTGGHWLNLKKGDQFGHVLLFDYYNDKLLKQQTIIYKELGNKITQGGHGVSQ